MSDTTNNLPAMLELLSEHGWTCEHPKTRCTIQDSDRVPHRCVIVRGVLWHFSDYIYLSDTGRVILTGGLHVAHPEDIDFATFVAWLQMPKPVWEMAAKALPGQRSLFD